jgi:hypothetical protein
MTNIAIPVSDIDRKMRLVARELAVDIMEPQTIVEKFDLSVAEWDSIIQHPQFKEMLIEEKERWNSSLNTRERVEYKTWQILEDALLKFQEYLHSPSFSDTAKVQLLQALQKQVGIGQRDTNPGAALGERFQITINMGGEVKVEQDITPQGKLIEGEVVNP